MHANNNFNYFMPTKILFGQGKIKELHKQILPGKKALIVISNGKSTRSFGYLDTVEQELSLAGCDFVVFDKVQPNPIKNNVMEGAACAIENNCDFVIGLGGGSSLDASKAIAAMATNSGDLWDYIGMGSGKNVPLQNPALPIINITTTAGTGSEADPWGVITKEDTNEKIGFGHISCFPVLSIVDPNLMTSVPSIYTAYQGFDTLFHCAEGYISNAGNILTDMLAIKAIENVSANLARAVKNGSDIEARSQMAFANTLGGFVMSMGSTCSQHSLEMALSGAHPSLAHGAGLIMISRSWFTFHARTGNSDARMVEMAKAMGKHDATCPLDFVEALLQLQKECGVDNLKMSDYGIQKSSLAEYAVMARKNSPLFQFDPTPLTDADAQAILEDAFA